MVNNRILLSSEPFLPPSSFLFWKHACCIFNSAFVKACACYSQNWKDVCAVACLRIRLLNLNDEGPRRENTKKPLVVYQKGAKAQDLLSNVKSCLMEAINKVRVDPEAAKSKQGGGQKRQWKTRTRKKRCLASFRRGGAGKRTSPGFQHSRQTGSRSVCLRLFLLSKA